MTDRTQSARPGTPCQGEARPVTAMVAVPGTLAGHHLYGSGGAGHGGPGAPLPVRTSTGAGDATMDETTTMNTTNTDKQRGVMVGPMGVGKQGLNKKGRETAEHDAATADAVAACAGLDARQLIAACDGVNAVAAYLAARHNARSMAQEALEAGLIGQPAWEGIAALDNVSGLSVVSATERFAASSRALATLASALGFSAENPKKKARDFATAAAKVVARMSADVTSPLIG